MSSASDLTSLLRRTTLTDHEEILRAANAALKSSKNDNTARHAQIVALLKLDRFTDALRAFDEAGHALKDKASLEYAYALYKAGELAKAEQVARAAGEGRGLLHVLAQTTYRLEKFQESKKLYEQLSQNADASSEESDLRINGSAVDAQLEWAGQGHLVGKKRPAREDLESFEGAYNAACGAIARGELGQAEVLLRRATQLCEASEELSEKEKQAEIVPIVVQQIYVLEQMGRQEEARKLVESQRIRKVNDLNVRLVARVNALAVFGMTNPYDAHRVFHDGLKLQKSDMPFGFQSAILHQDEYAIDLLALKFPGVARSTANFLSKRPSPSTSASVGTVSVLNAAAHARCEDGKAGLKAILPLLEQRPNDVGLLLTVVHLYLLTNNHGSAITLMEKFLSHLEQSTSPADADVRHAPGLVSTLVSLYALQGRKTHIRNELAKAAAYWLSKRKDDEPGPLKHTGLLKAAGEALLTSPDPSDIKAAADIFSDLYSADATDKTSLAGLVAALSATDPSQISPQLLTSLPQPSQLVSTLDATALEDAGVASLPASQAAATKKRPAEEAQVPKKKKIRPSRMPKDFEEGRKMDPERWLPLRDRSYWRPKGKKGKKKAEGLTQGGIAEGESMSRTGSGTGAPAAAHAAGGGGGKKKKKGKR